MTFQLPRVYPIVDTATLRRRNFKPVHAAAALLEGGAKILQFRHKGFWSRDVFAEAEQIAALCHSTSALFVVNDRADYAMLLQAALHLGQEDLSPADARKVIGDEAIIGFSTHNPDQMRAAAFEPVNHVAFGPIFATASKERPDATVGLEGLATVRALTGRPLIAIGGITQENAVLCWRAGADSVAVIAGMLPAECTPQSLRARAEEWLELCR
jgi:thiamine-phosphate pyrophosphorylase